ncbi:hypothetical protein SCATT_03200 [Streptantibioticus cattleyicolor NRRL 8057 = DSM 46488]|uniref:Uncharacterized protein n=1 Tax=Streptantibioticus cattleyicolor (strain ATCC 35852 / DSM 46488 / JCM 4925 / NBRC 14057 / NRRL 8057) TaxID=1003195 RepID=G8WMX3_STREN|nr:hypothetical protein SCATT_03200 [Streptantibioticus cattleyicolor NRRL 8057 = DSM 46488]
MGGGRGGDGRSPRLGGERGGGCEGDGPAVAVTARVRGRAGRMCSPCVEWSRDD